MLVVVGLAGVGQAAGSNSSTKPWWQRAAERAVSNLKREAATQIGILSAAATTFTETYASTGNARQAMGRAAQTVLIAETVYFTFTGPLTWITR